GGGQRGGGGRAPACPCGGGGSISWSIPPSSRGVRSRRRPCPSGVMRVSIASKSCKPIMAAISICCVANRSTLGKLTRPTKNEEEGSMKKFNPRDVAAPAGPYSHGIEVPPNARWLYLAGQIGVAPDGKVAPDFETQADQCWRNIKAILAEAGMGVENLVKCTHFLTRAENIAAYGKVRAKHVG